MSASTKMLPHTTPSYSEASRDDALFHYTTGSGLLGILKTNELWSTAYYCANDESELRAGKDILTRVFRNKTDELIRTGDQRVNVFRSRGVDVRDCADQFEKTILSFALHVLGVYITCFCKPQSEEDFHHGLLSQWRGYGIDGGYAIQFSRVKLEKYIELVREDIGAQYEIQDVHYSPENPLKDEVLKHSSAFIDAYLQHLDTLVELNFNQETFQNPIANLLGGPLESLLDYFIHTKSAHFAEERECRMSVLVPASAGSGKLAVDFFNRNGLIVPYTKSPREVNLLECVDWIVIGPSPRIVHRFNSVSQMVKKMGLKIGMRPSHIPFSRA